MCVDPNWPKASIPPRKSSTSFQSADAAYPKSTGSPSLSDFCAIKFRREGSLAVLQEQLCFDLVRAAADSFIVAVEGDVRINCLDVAERKDAFGEL